MSKRLGRQPLPAKALARDRQASASRRPLADGVKAAVGAKVLSPVWGGPVVASVSGFLTRHSWLLWVGPTLTVLACASDRLSGHYIPKVFWASLTTAVGLALAPLVRRPGDVAPAVALTPLGLFWGLFMAWALLSFLWSPAPAVGLERWEALLLPTAAYFLARRSRFWEFDAFWIFFCILFGGESLLGFLEYVSFDPVKARLAAWLPAVLSGPLTGALDHLKALVTALPGTSVPRATLGHRNYVAFYCMVALPFAAWAYFRARGWRAAIVPGTALALGILFLLLSRVRGAWVGTALAALAALSGGGAVRLWRRPRHLAAMAGAGVLALGLVLLAKPSGEFERYGYIHKVTLLQTVQHLFDDNGRFAMWFEALGHSNPWLGTGFGNSPIIISPWATDGRIKALNWELHNDYLQALMDLGGAGATLFALAVGAALLTAWRARKGEGRRTKDEERRAKDEGRSAKDEGRSAKDEGRSAKDEGRSAKDEGRRAKDEERRAKDECSPSVVLASLAALAGTAFMLGTTFMAQLVATQMWLAGALAIVGAQSASSAHVVWGRPVPRYAARLLRGAAVLWLLLLSFRAYEATGADRQLVETLLAIPDVLTDDSTPVAKRQEEARVLLRTAARDILPHARFDTNMIHLQCYELAKASAELGALDAARIFAERAVRLHPSDSDTLGALAQIHIYAKRPRDAVARLEQIVHWYGYDPYSDTSGRLANLYDELGQSDKARATRAEAAANRVGVPADPRPGDGARGLPRQVVFQWSPCNAAEAYDLYVWKEGRAVPEEPLLKNLRTPEAHPQVQAEPGAHYYWRVRVIGRYHTEWSPRWGFTTAGDK